MIESGQLREAIPPKVRTHFGTKTYENSLNEAFPETALALVAFLKKQNKRDKLLPQWRETQVQNFVIVLNLTAFDLDRARREKRIGTLAWSARNFLELNIWIEYCFVSVETARRFQQDAGRDLFGMVLGVKSGAKTDEHKRMTTAMIERLQRVLNKNSFVIDPSYKRVAEAAKELGHERSYASKNKVISN